MEKTSSRQLSTEYRQPHSDSNNESTEPSSSHFDPVSWARHFQESRTLTGGGHSLRLGLAFRALNVYGFGKSTDYQSTVGTFALELLTYIKDVVGCGASSSTRQDILRDLEGVLYPGETLAVLGPPGSGCSTFLKTITGDTYGFNVEDESELNYHGISRADMWATLRSEAVYTAEDDHHLPHLTVGETLYFAARSRNLCPPPGLTHRQFAEHLRDVVMKLMGISHTLNTKVGDDFIRGVSGGERKRVSISEVLLGWAPIQSWDNSTRGLDSGSAIQFCKVLRLQADILGITSSVAIYQAPEEAYKQFDKVIVLFQGRQIFFGRTGDAKAYFEGLGFHCPEQQTTADFLTSMTRREERIVKAGFEDQVPQTPDDFAAAWKRSRTRSTLLQDLDQYQRDFPFADEEGTKSALQKFVGTRMLYQSSGARKLSPCLLSYFGQVRLLLWRSASLLRRDPSLPFTMLGSNTIIGLILGSVFYNLQPETSTLFRRGILLFLSLVVNALAGILEILTLYIKRKTVDKQARYGLYRPSAEAVASFVVDLPYKITNTIIFNLIIYFMTNLRREPGPFFFYILVSFAAMLTLSLWFRLLGSLTRNVEQCLAPAAIILLSIMIFSGFTIPPRYLDDWIGWQRWISPLYYCMESLMVNEFVGRQFSCSDFVPRASGTMYSDISSVQRTCQVDGAAPGEGMINGTQYLRLVYGFENSHKWRDFGLIIVLGVAAAILHLIATEYIVSERSKGEVLVFKFNAMRDKLKAGSDPEAAPSQSSATSKAVFSKPDQVSGSETETDMRAQAKDTDLHRHKSIFHWKDVCYDIQAYDSTRRLLDHVDGWIKPGTLTALMGASGAGKTTLLDVLADRKSVGVVSGGIFVNGTPRDASFQRKTGYAQQQDLHQATSTVREALNFSAVLRQPENYSRAEKIAYVDEVIGLLSMEEFADAVIGEVGSGLNVEQRKRLTIGIELAARPELLVFLDEPTSGLDSQTSQSICDLLETLTRAGQAILCTVHQPSSTLFQRFDRLLLLTTGGRTVYFGDIGPQAGVLLDYFARNGGAQHMPGQNPAEYMLQIIGGRSTGEKDWHQVWRESPEYQEVQRELSQLARATQDEGKRSLSPANEVHREFAASFRVQFAEVSKRMFRHYWRNPTYIFSRAVLSFGSALFIGLSLINGENDARGVQNQMFNVFFFLFIFSQVVEQMLPVFAEQRKLYEAREWPSKTYSWPVFLFTQILIEFVWNSAMGALSFICWYFPLGFYRNAQHDGTAGSRAVTMLLIIWAFFAYTTSFAYIIIGGLETADIAGAVVILAVLIMFAFCGVLQFPGFWMFMYRLNPFTYAVEGLLGVSLANAPVRCAEWELLEIRTPKGSHCKDYLRPHIDEHGGYIASGSASAGGACRYCPMSNTNDFLDTVNVEYGNRWRDFGILWAFTVFNVAFALFVFWLARVPHKKLSIKGKKE